MPSPEQSMAKVPRIAENGLFEPVCPLTLDQAPWPTYRGNISVRLDLGWTPSALICRWQVGEPSVLARFSRNNDPVYQDSCVEAFLSFSGAAEYINIECNAIGTVLAARGGKRSERVPLTTNEMAELDRRSSLGPEPILVERALTAPWSLEMTIPFVLIPGCPSQVGPGISIRANFYKCGDKLINPHYHTWAPILSEKPDFHLPDFFGTLILVEKP